jgi:hypothetical protein
MSISSSQCRFPPTCNKYSSRAKIVNSSFDRSSKLVLSIKTNLNLAFLYENKIKVRSWSTVTRFLALFILVYAVADISVLQVYCGNESLGIPPEHHAVSISHVNDHSADICEVNDQFGCEQPTDDHDYDHRHQCFCWQQVVVAFVSFDLGSVTKFTRVHPPVFYEDLHSDSAPTHLFRPPRTS